MGIVTSTSETAFTQSAETVYDFVTNPANWTKTYPGSMHIAKLPEVPLQVGDTREETGSELFQQANPARIDAYHAAVARELSQSGN